MSENKQNAYDGIERREYPVTDRREHTDSEFKLYSVLCKDRFMLLEEKVDLLMMKIENGLSKTVIKLEKDLGKFLKLILWFLGITIAGGIGLMFWLIQELIKARVG